MRVSHLLCGRPASISIITSMEVERASMLEWAASDIFNWKHFLNRIQTDRRRPEWYQCHLHFSDTVAPLQSPICGTWWAQRSFSHGTKVRRQMWNPIGSIVHWAARVSHLKHLSLFQRRQHRLQTHVCRMIQCIIMESQRWIALSMKALWCKRVNSLPKQWLFCFNIGSLPEMELFAAISHYQ